MCAGPGANMRPSSRGSGAAPSQRLLALLDGVAQRAHDVLLTHHLGEAAGTVAGKERARLTMRASLGGDATQGPVRPRITSSYGALYAVRPWAVLATNR